MIAHCLLDVIIFEYAVHKPSCFESGASCELGCTIQLTKFMSCHKSKNTDELAEKKLQIHHSKKAFSTDSETLIQSTKSNLHWQSVPDAQCQDGEGFTSSLHVVGTVSLGGNRTPQQPLSDLRLKQIS